MALKVYITEEQNQYGLSFPEAYIKVESFTYDSITDIVTLKVVGYGNGVVGGKKRDQKKAAKELQKASLTDSQKAYYEEVQHYQASSIYEDTFSFKASDVIPDGEYYALEQDNMIRLGYVWLKSIGAVFPTAEDILEPGQDKNLKMIIQKNK